MTRDLSSNEPLGSVIDRLAEELSGKLSSAVSKFVLSGNTGLDSWREMMARELKGPLVEYMLGEFNDGLVERGLTPIGRERASVLVVDALHNTSDLRSRLLSAPDPSGVLAAGRFSLGALVDRTHQLGIVQSLIRFVTGKATNLSGESGDGYTGRKRWRTSVPDSRHLGLDFQEAGFDGKWQVGTERWDYPRQDPTNAAMSSGCKCFTEYLYINPETGEEEWL